MTKVIFKSEIPELLVELSKQGEVFAPVLRGHSFDSVVFKHFEKNDLLALPYGVSVLPPKQFMLPPKEELFSFIKEKITEPVVGKFIIFGANYHDISAITKLDKVFSAGIEDTAYQRRKEKRMVIGVDRFSPPSEGYDLYLMETEPELYVAFAGTKKGTEVLKSRVFKNKTLKTTQTKKVPDTLLSNPQLSNAVEKSRKNPVWKELSEKCFGCGICSYVCPLCYCFESEDVLDTVGTPEAGKRLRTWDSCLLPHFSETNAGNFRRELEDRIYNWYFHKFVRMPKEVGFVGCVDCNRCIVYCPAKINYRQTLQRILADYQKENKTIVNKALSGGKK